MACEAEIVPTEELLADDQLPAWWRFAMVREHQEEVGGG